MPLKKSWLLRVPEIRQDVAALDVLVVDRILFERLFHVRRRRAVALLHTFGGYLAGQTLLIDRAELVRQLEALEAGAEFAIEQARRQRLLDTLEKVRRQRAAAAVHIPVPADVAERSAADLPAGICLEPGSLPDWPARRVTMLRALRRASRTRSSQWRLDPHPSSGGTVGGIAEPARCAVRSSWGEQLIDHG